MRRTSASTADGRSENVHGEVYSQLINRLVKDSARQAQLFRAIEDGASLQLGQRSDVRSPGHSRQTRFENAFAYCAGQCRAAADPSVASIRQCEDLNMLADSLVQPGGPIAGIIVGYFSRHRAGRSNGNANYKFFGPLSCAPHAY